MTDVAICVITYRRPRPLARLLTSLQQLDVPTGCSIRVLVVDNDPAGSARKVVRDSGQVLAVSYELEPRPGIAAARNRAVEAALPCDLIAFVDDDMTVEPDWLVRMTDALAEHDADMVNGVVKPAFEGGHSRWVDASLFTRRRHPTGTTLSRAATGGLLFRATVSEQMAPMFDEAFGLLGGEDTDMSRRAVQAGMRIVFCGEALAHEHTPEVRARARWVLRRAFRLGNTVALSAVRTADDRRWRAGIRWRVALSGAGRIAVGVVGVLSTLPARDPVAVTARCRRVLQGAGFIAGALGWEFEEYGRDRLRTTQGGHEQRRAGADLL
ncbi:MAG: glycosyltransferase [Actinobacteria bacterium]|nr:glycosyltransferase [Actinomycetota bacterium]